MSIFICAVDLQVGESGIAVGIEHIKELVDQSVRNVQKGKLKYMVTHLRASRLNTATNMIPYFLINRLL